MRATQHTFWPDDLSLVNVSSQNSEQSCFWPFVTGHRQVTDAYLLALVQENQGKLATLDKGIGSLIPDDTLRNSLLEFLE